MIPMLLPLLLSPTAIISSVLALLTICGGACCIRQWRKFRIRHFGCVKRWLRLTGVDGFDDFDLLCHIHEVKFTGEKKMKFRVRVVAGDQEVKTSVTKGIFQNTLSVFIEQGTTDVLFELVTGSDVVLAQIRLDLKRDILDKINDAKHAQPLRQKVFKMKQKSKGLLDPSIVVSMTMSDGTDEEEGLLSGTNPETAFLMRDKLAAAKEEILHKSPRNAGMSTELEVLMQACSGPIDVFEETGAASRVAIAVMGPPFSRRFFLGMWQRQRDMEAYQKVSEDGKAKVDAWREIDLLKIHGVQEDPDRSEVFVISYRSKSEGDMQTSFRIVDRPAKLWVEMLSQLISHAHQYNKGKKRRP
eukprot:TRINITY_DN142_c0_g1_i2.p1 TRINITY_DN142_c0_g1~~TRINITY_DN142_c0_g1_i2.p1  ORF type:complete len:357 (-),score=66.99 TRINITY_DN142_c0_g1_i2:104-1174(-)